MFAAHGLGDTAISGLFVVWSVVTLLAEVPTGVWADTVPRRRLLVGASLIYAAGFACWTFGTGFAAFALGFGCWGLSSTLLSGTWEALVFDQLAAAGASRRYTAVLGAAESLSLLANLAATAAAVPLLAWGGFRLVGWVSIGVALLGAALARSLPPVAVESPTVQPFTGRYRQMLRSGFTELGLSRRGGRPGLPPSGAPLRAAVLIAALLLSAEVFDEYFPLLAADRGAPLTTVPVLVAVTVLGQAAGAATAGRTQAWGRRSIGGALLAGAALMIAGALAGAVWPAFLLLAAGYGVVANLMVTTEARAQHAITGPARATITSVISLATQLLEIAWYGALGVAAGLLPLGPVLAGLAVLLVPVALLVAHRLPDLPTSPD